MLLGHLTSTTIATAEVNPTESDPPAAAATSPGPGAPTSADEVELIRLDASLRGLDAGYQSYRWWGGVSSMVVGGAIMPVGIAAYGQNTRQPFAGIITTAFGAGLVGGGLALLAIPPGVHYSFDSLVDSIDSQRRGGIAPRSIIAAVEADWQSRAARARSQRRTLAWIAGSLSVLLVGGGSYIALTPSSMMSTTKRQTLGALYIGAGAIALPLSLQAYFIESPVELGWHAYSAGRPIRGASQPQSRLGVAPIFGGAVLHWGTTF